MSDIVNTRLQLAFSLTKDFVSLLDNEQLLLKIPGVRSNSISSQLWCVVGARESYLEAINKGEWVGFNCSLSEDFGRDDILLALDSTSDSLNGLSSIEEGHLELYLKLLEHEVQHHGQLIRYVYANELGFPESWSRRYTV